MSTAVEKCVCLIMEHNVHQIVPSWLEVSIELQQQYVKH